MFLERQTLAVDRIETELRRLQDSGAELNVLIQADRAVAFGTVAQVMAAVQRAGITRLAFVTAPE